MHHDYRQCEIFLAFSSITIHSTSSIINYEDGRINNVKESSNIY